MTSFVTYLWNQPGYHTTYSAEHVNALQSMLARHYASQFRFFCVTRHPRGLAPTVSVVPDVEDFPELQNPHGLAYPSCYRRLRLFSAAASETFGMRIVALDLDVVITGPVTKLFDRDDDFVAWQDPDRPTDYNCSLMMLTAGARSRVWSTFDPTESPRIAKQAGRKGSDQAWVSYCLGRKEATWSRRDGVYSFPRTNGITYDLPADARVVVFHGRVKPWSEQAQLIPWVREHYR